MADLKRWLPINKKELEIRGWNEVDVVIVSGDAYIDHPSFGHAIIARLIENQGYKVAILPQPNWRDDLRDFKKFGKPRLFFGITSGAMDSMVNHYTALKRLRSTDAYTPGNVSGFRPDYAVNVYSNIIRKLFPDSFIIIGGIEASQRRLTHYDYWSDSLMPSILYTSKADILTYGMSEKSIIDILNVFKKNSKPKTEDFVKIPQITYLSNQTIENENIIRLSSHDDCLKSKRKFAETFSIIETASNQINPPILSQAIKDKFVIVNPPYPPISSSELDKIYELPFTRLPHPHYEKRGEIPAFNMINCSVNIHRGCFGGCSFCTISMHQGKQISSRSQKSILKEVENISKMPYFKGYISDLGGPSANMYGAHGIDKALCNVCKRSSCIYPKICHNLNFDHKPLIDLYNKVNSLPKIKKVSIGSGIRMDMIEYSDAKKCKEYHLNEYAEQLIVKHVSGRLKVAPEHTEDNVLAQMRKPSYSVFLKFKDRFDRINRKFRLNQQLIPYFISSHPGCKLQDMQTLSKKIKENPEQVQDFTPTPMTRSSVMFYTGLIPETLKKVFCETDLQKKRLQNQCFFKNKNYRRNQMKKY